MLISNTIVPSSEYLSIYKIRHFPLDLLNIIYRMYSVHSYTAVLLENYVVYVKNIMFLKCKLINV